MENAVSSRLADRTVKTPAVDPPLRRSTRTSAAFLARAQYSLTVGSVDDPAEAEADRVAEHVIRRLHHVGTNAEAEQPPADTGVPAGRVRRAPATGATESIDPGLADRVQRARRGGTPLPEPVRRTMETGFGTDLSHVRAHTGPDTDALNAELGARAFAVGNDVFFSGGIPDGNTESGQRLIAHELAHTMQQGGRVQRSVIRRKGGDKTVAEQLEPYIESRTKKLRKQLEKDFGLKGMKGGRSGKSDNDWRRHVKKKLGYRSGEARDWRWYIKDEARKRAHADVERALDDYQDDADQDDKKHKLTDTEKQYFGITARKKVYDKSKKVVDDVVGKTIGTVLKDVFNLATVRGAANAAVSAYRQNNPGDEAGAWSVAKTEVDRAFESAKETLKAAKRRVFDTSKQGDKGGSDVDDVADKMDKDALGTASAAKVTKRGIGEKAVKTVIEADSVDRGIGLFGKFLDSVVGSSGDQVSLSVEFKVPIDPATGGGYVSFTLAGKAARGIDGAMTAGVPIFGDPRRLEMMGEFTFRLGYGYEDVFDIGADLKIFSRTGADSTQLCMDAISYGAYRRLTGMGLWKMANWWAGRAKGVEEGKAQRAEAWAAMVEERAFVKGGAFSDLGVGGGASMQIGNDEIGGAKVEGGLSAFHRYDKASLEKTKAREDKKRQADPSRPEYKYAEPVADKADAQNRRKRARGRAGGAWSFGTNVMFNVGDQGANIAVSASGAMPPKTGRLKNWGVEISTTISYSHSATDPATQLEKIAAGYVEGAAHGLKTLMKVVKMSANDDPDLGIFVDTVSDTTTVLNTTMDNGIANSLGSATFTQAGEQVSYIGTKQTLELALLFGENDGQWIGRFEVRGGRALDVNAPLAGNGGVKVTGEKKSRLLAVGFDSGGKFDIEFAGARARGKTNQHGEKHRM